MCKMVQNRCKVGATCSKMVQNGCKIFCTHFATGCYRLHLLCYRLQQSSGPHTPPVPVSELGEWELLYKLWNNLALLHRSEGGEWQAGGEGGRGWLRAAVLGRPRAPRGAHGRPRPPTVVHGRPRSPTAAHGCPRSPLSGSLKVGSHEIAADLPKQSNLLTNGEGYHVL